jgi:ribosomal protein S27AE
MTDLSHGLIQPLPEPDWDAWLASLEPPEPADQLAAAMRYWQAKVERAAERAAERSITCPRCGWTSHHPADVEHGYCGHCHAFTSPPRAQR